MLTATMIREIHQDEEQVPGIDGQEELNPMEQMSREQVFDRAISEHAPTAGEAQVYIARTWRVRVPMHKGVKAYDKLRIGYKREIDRLLDCPHGAPDGCWSSRQGSRHLSVVPKATRPRVAGGPLPSRDRVPGVPVAQRGEQLSLGLDLAVAPVAAQEGGVA